MPRRREPGRVSPRRQRRDDRKPQALMDIVVGAVRRLGAQMGVSVTDIERCAVAEGDLPARAGARSILRLGLNRAVESGRLQRMPGGLFRLVNDTAEKEDKLQPNSAHVDDAAVEVVEAVECLERRASDDAFSRELEAALEGAAANAVEPKDDDVHLVDMCGLQDLQLPQRRSRRRLYERIDSVDQPLGKTLSKMSRRRRSPSEEERRAAQSRSDADHGRAAAAALFKLAADVMNVVSQTASARLNSFAVESGGDSDPDAQIVSQRASAGSCESVEADTQHVVTATGSALSGIAGAAARGSIRVIEVSSTTILADEDGESCGSGTGATKDAIFRAFKAAAMDIVRAAREFGEALGGSMEVEQSGPPGANHNNRDDCDTSDLFQQMPVSFGAPDITSMFPRPEPDMEDFLRDLLQDVRELAQRVGNCIDN